ncbi:hypothetical protein [Pleomorphomonas sp. NRK KF1]|uniref:hypothetical protein n=1 Tax=Pleomorphomonas sp. NRK KF1 TaxID=2943000 RepID=UPI0020432742|nr:hypothetical protein [Pleomorphomonas sp. NRK KF1]MCM5553833.1 hypothetical protein [Pleomorphomonas sp. NRK KF1]
MLMIEEYHRFLDSQQRRLRHMRSQGEMNGTGMANGDLNRISNLTWGIADGALRNLSSRQVLKTGR